MRSMWLWIHPERFNYKIKTDVNVNYLVLISVSTRVSLFYALFWVFELNLISKWQKMWLESEELKSMKGFLSSVKWSK